MTCTKQTEWSGVAGPAGSCSPVKPCGICEGDCNTDADCAAGLLCFQRDEPHQTVPGCARSGYTATPLEDWDYCYQPSAQCAAEKTVDEAAMKKTGWTFKDFDGKKNLAGQNKCTATAWHGYGNEGKVATLSKVLRGSGAATLDFGNCWNAGKTNVYLNGKLLDSAGPKTASKTVLFGYKDGDKLELRDEEGNAVLMTSKLTLCAAARTVAPQGTYMGCFTDATDGKRDLPTKMAGAFSSHAVCTSACKAAGFGFSGGQYTNECRCGHSYGSQGKATNCGANGALCLNGKYDCRYANAVFSTGRVQAAALASIRVNGAVDAQQMRAWTFPTPATMLSLGAQHDGSRTSFYWGQIGNVRVDSSTGQFSPGPCLVPLLRAQRMHGGCVSCANPCWLRLS